MVIVKIYSNTILIEPMKLRKDAKMIWAYDVLVQRLLAANIHPQKLVLNNQILDKMKLHIKEKYKFQLEMVPPGNQGGHQEFQGALPQHPRGNGRLISAPPLGQTSATDQNNSQLTTPIQCHTQRVGIRTPVEVI